MAFEPLHISAHLGTPAVAYPALPLDGMLLSAAMMLHHGDHAGALQPGEVTAYDPSLVPLAIHNEHKEWFYACSFAIWETFCDYQDYWHRRFDDQLSDYLMPDASKIDVTAGKYKSYRTPVTYRHCLAINWYAVGDRDAVTRLLAHIPYIGKKTSQGWGHVLAWRIEAVAEDWSVIYHDTLLRATPPSYFDEFRITWNIGYHAFRPPYWSKDNMGMVYTP